jgi:solute carrier family 25 (mitochondrial folate transporter), member 32
MHRDGFDPGGSAVSVLCHQTPISRHRSYLRQQDPPRPLTSIHHLLAAFEAGIIMVFLTNPLWLIKTRMQLQPSAGVGGLKETQEAYRGLWHAVRTIVREEGPLGLYKGEMEGRLAFPLAPTPSLYSPHTHSPKKRHTNICLPPPIHHPPPGLLPAILLTSHGALQFVTYEWLKRVAEPYHVPLLSYSVLGGVAKIVAGLATYPYQVTQADENGRVGVWGGGDAGMS